MSGRLRLFLFFLFFNPILLPAQEKGPDYVFENAVFYDQFKTVRLHPQNDELGEAVLRLGSTEQLLFSFDKLGFESGDFGYRIRHCNADWTLSSLIEMEYLEGFFDGHITDARNSFSTSVPYMHYELLLPNSEVRPTVSGNYILEVFSIDSSEVTLISRRFRITENLATISLRIHHPDLVEYSMTHQEADVLVQSEKMRSADPMNDFKLYIFQNERNDNAVGALKPAFINGSELSYDYENGNLFEGTNEFRYFDTRTTRYSTPLTSVLVRDSMSGQYMFVLDPIISRASMRYASENDINGRYIIKSYESDDSRVECDYVLVQFIYPNAYPQGKELYLIGQFNDWKPDSLSKMEYDERMKAFRLTQPVKQGYYNYMLVQRDETGRFSTLETEGSHPQTSNFYQVFLYFRPAAAKFDRLVGYYRSEQRAR